MDYKAEPSNKKKIYYNYFSHAKKDDISTKSDFLDIYNNPSNEQIENSFTQTKRFCSQKKFLPWTKYNQNVISPFRHFC